MIKNIFWDVDGVLANLDMACFNFLTKHPKYSPEFSNLKFEDLPNVLPMNPKCDILFLSNHPTRGQEMGADFATSEFYDDRPLYDGAREIIAELGRRGFNQATMSAAGKSVEERKLALLNSYFHGLPIEIRIASFRDGKEDYMKKFMAEHNWKPEETALIDDMALNLRTAERMGIKPLRARWAIIDDLPDDLKHVPEFANFNELLTYLTEQK